MSLLPFTTHAKLAISMFSIPITITDTIYTTVNGIDRQGTPTTRTIQAAVEVRERKLEQIFGGSVSDGDIGIYPLEDDLYFLDNYTIGVTIRKQSFFPYHNNQYRIIGVSDFTDQAGVKVYLATKHIAQDLV